MRHTWIVLLVAACATRPPPVPSPGDLPFASAHLARAAVATAGAPGVWPGRRAEPPVVPPFTAADEVRDLVTVREDLRAAAGDPGPLLEHPLACDDLAALAWLRSPDVAAARARLEAARTGYAQSSDLADLVATYRAFARETETRVGPDRSRRPAATVAPSQNVDALSGAIVARSVAIAAEELRRVVRRTVAEAQRAHADAARLAPARRVLRDEVALSESLVAALEARFVAGRATNAGLLAFRGRLASLRTELAVLDAEEAAVRARWNRLLGRPAGAPLALDVAPASAAPVPNDVEALALRERQELRIARLEAERAALATRLAETMALPRLDAGASRFERERGAERFPPPGRTVVSPAAAGVSLAQLEEMRARQQAAETGRDAWRDRVQAEVAEAVFAVEAADRRFAVHDEELVPLAERSFESTRGGYEGAGTDYVELLDAARRLLAARLGRIDARKAQADARARLLEAVGVQR